MFLKKVVVYVLSQGVKLTFVNNPVQDTSSIKRVIIEVPVTDRSDGKRD